MTLIALTILLSIIVLTANEYELRKRKQRRRLECERRINTLEYQLGLRWDQASEHHHISGITDMPGVVIPVEHSPMDIYMQGLRDEITRISGTAEVTMGMSREQEARPINERRQEQYKASIDRLRRSLS